MLGIIWDLVITGYLLKSNWRVQFFMKKTRMNFENTEMIRQLCWWVLCSSWNQSKNNCWTIEYGRTTILSNSLLVGEKIQENDRKSNKIKFQSQIFHNKTCFPFLENQQNFISLFYIPPFSQQPNGLYTKQIK